MDSFVVFGAGNFGKKAIEYYGESRIEFILDNDISKTGTLVCGKRVVSFDEYLMMDQKHRIVIAVNHPESIIKQLIDNNVSDFFVFRPEFCVVREYLLKRKSKVNAIYLVGRDHSTDGIIETLQQIGMIIKVRGSIATENDEPVNIKSIKEYANISDALDGDCYIVSKFKSHILINDLLEQSIEKKYIIDPYYCRSFYSTDSLVINPYDCKEQNRNEDEWNCILEGNIPIREEIREYVDALCNNPPLFKFIEIETINRCNGICSFCPVNKNADTRKETIMRRDLFAKIINELSEIGYDGHLSLFSNNEPFLDGRIIEFCELARDKLPEAYLYLYSNGTMITLDGFERIIKVLDELIVDNYSTNHKVIKPVKEIIDSISDSPELRRKLTVIIRDPNEVLTSRGGDAPNRSKVRSFKSETCALPFRQMVIRPDGKVSLCCNDPLGRETLGDLNEQGLVEVWYGKKYKDVREKIQNGRGKLAHCVNCDTFYLF